MKPVAWEAAKIVPMACTAKNFSAILDQHSNHAVIQRQHPAIHQLFFCMLRQQKRRLIGACMLAPCLGFTGSLRTLCNCQCLLRVCFDSGLGNRARASLTISVRSKDRLPVARGAADPGRITGGIETSSGSHSTAVRPASAAVGKRTLKMTDCTSSSPARSGKSTTTRLWLGLGRDSSNPNEQDRN